MKTLIVISQEDDWPFDLPGAHVVSTSNYLTQPQYSRMRDVTVLNLAQPNDYQSSGYYVSMLAEARGHRPWPDVKELEDRHSPEMGQAASAWLARRRRRQTHDSQRPSLAILRTPGATAMPSNQGAISRFCQAARELGMDAEVITRDDAARIAEFDALFIRDTTNVNDYTYQISRQASICGLVVMDDPDSIVRCSNKVFLHELLSRHDIPTPRTLLVHRGNLDQVLPELGVPVILKLPDSAFSMGVTKVHDARQLRETAQAMFAHSELLLAQEYLPTAFDWRIGVLANKALFACRYHMASGHWQVIKHEGDSRYSEGLAEAVPLAEVPAQVLETALSAVALIGDGFYGVDLKERDGRCYLIEINDNPNVDAGNEDGVLQQDLYREVMGVIRRRIALRRDAAR